MTDKLIGAIVVPHMEPLSDGEIARTLDRIEKSIDVMSGKLDNRPTHADLERVEHGLQVRIASLEDWNKWAHRLIIGAVGAAILGLVLVTTGTVPAL